MRLRTALYILLLLCATASAQTTGEVEAVDKLKEYTTNIIQYNKAYPQEKVYLHMDNRSYFIGDTIWFKAYVMNATTLHPTQMSGVLYVELLNEMGVEVEHKKMRMENGMCHGNFILKEDYRTGYYEIRAYTRYMLNWGNDYSEPSFLGHVGSGKEGPIECQLYPSDDPRALAPVLEYTNSRCEIESDEDLLKIRDEVVPDPNLFIFSRVFPVYTHPEVAGEYKKDMDSYPYHTKLTLPSETSYELRPDNLNLAFFPEGGALVNGVTSVVAFEATDQWGRKCEIEGYITEGKKSKNTITHFQTTARGRGVFPLCPTSEKGYYAHVTFKNKEYTFELPQVEPMGCVLRVRPPMVGGDMAFQILCPADMPSEPLAWTLQCRGALTGYDTLTSRESTTVVVPKEQLRTGVNQLTVFNTEGNILADRLFFVCPSKETAVLAASLLPDTLKPFEKVDIGFQLQRTTGWLNQGHFSLSITDANELEHDTYDTRDIRSELLLTSDIKGFVEDVDSYFRHASDNAMVADIDLLMRIQGWRLHTLNREWRRYNWYAMSGAMPFDYKYTPEKGLGIDGYIISEHVTRKGRLTSPNVYDRIPHLKVHASLEANGASINETTYADSTASYSISFAPVFYGEVPMTITLEDTLSHDFRKRKKKSRLTKSQVVIKRAFSPKPTPYSHYQHKRPSEDIWFDVAIGADDYSTEQNLQEVNVKKRRTRSWDIYYDRPELVVDYTKEWNFIIDRGTPWANGRRVFSNKHDAEQGMNFPWLSYSLARLNARHSSTIKDDSVYFHYNTLMERYSTPYIMPKTIRVYSNLLGREPSRGSFTYSEYRYYMVVEHFKKSESPKHAPYLSKHGIRHTFYEGYSRSCEFYERDYSECALPDSTDYRRTLHWDPDVWTDNLGRASVTFYNNARTKHLHIRAEGFTRNGEFIVYDSERK